MMTIRQWIRKRCHWQNLNENRITGKTGSILREGRIWFHRIWKDDTKHRNSIMVSWAIPSWHVGIDAQICDGDTERDLTLFFGCGLALWVTLEGIVPQRLKNRIQFGSQLRARIVDTIGRVTYDKKNEGAYQYGAKVQDVLFALYRQDSSLTDLQYDHEMRKLFDDRIIQMRTNNMEYRISTVHEADTAYWPREIGIKFHSGTIWFSLWNPEMWSSSSQPKWWTFNINILDFLLGRWKCEVRTISEHDTVVPMPEGSYPAHVKIVERTWKRPRWFIKRRLSSEIDIPGGIPFEGKGENSWDCGTDGLFGTGSSDPTVEGAVAEAVKSVLKSRRRYGTPSDEYLTEAVAKAQQA